MRKRGYAVILLCLTLLCACGRNEKIKEQPQSEKAQELVIWAYYETQAQKDGLDRLIRDFNQSQTEYAASWEYVPMTGFTRGLSSAYTENELPDMAIIDNPDMPALIRMGLFEDITEQVQDWDAIRDSHPSVVSTLELDGRYYGIPFNCNTTALIYNSALLEKNKLEVPSSWEELREAAKKLTQGEQKGFVMCGLASEQGAFQILSWILAAGEDPQQLGGEATEEAFSFLSSLLEDGSMSGNCINLTQTDLALEFIEGRAAMMQNGPWVLPMLDEAGIPYEIASIPGKTPGAAVVGGENIGILKGKNVQGSLAFLRFCVEGEELTDFCREASVLPASVSAAKESARENDKMEVFESQMEKAVVRTSIPRWNSVSQKLTDGFYQLVTGETTPREIADSIKSVD